MLVWAGRCHLARWVDSQFSPRSYRCLQAMLIDLVFAATAMLAFGRVIYSDEYL